jgi:hypothetical protein
MKKERKEAFFRILVAIVAGVILHFWGIAACIGAVINWLIALFAAKRNKGLADFFENWNTQIYVFSRYLAGVVNERPFPFNSLSPRMSKFSK